MLAAASLPATPLPCLPAGRHEKLEEDRAAAGRGGWEGGGRIKAAGPASQVCTHAALTLRCALQRSCCTLLRFAELHSGLVARLPEGGFAEPVPVLNTIPASGRNFPAPARPPLLRFFTGCARRMPLRPAARSPGWTRLLTSWIP